MQACASLFFFLIMSSAMQSSLFDSPAEQTEQRNNQLSPPSVRIDELISSIEKANYAYYILAEPILSDYEFDMLLKELEALEQQYPELIRSTSPTQRVNGEPLKEFTQVQHASPMLSLQNTYNADEVREFDRRVSDVLRDNGIEEYEYVADLKYDGVAISLIYLNGKLELAATRGDGVQGDNVTANVRTIKAIPLHIEPVIINGIALSNFEVRGEVFMMSDDFLQLNQEREEAGEKLYANPRNLTAGTLKLLDPTLVARRPLTMVCYFLSADGIALHSQEENMKLLHAMGFPIAWTSGLCRTIDEVLNIIYSWEVRRETLPFQTDGMVIKVNRLQHQRVLGAIAKFPRWAIAYKYSAKQAHTVLRDISIQVGRTGIATPVAELDPVLLAGSTISRATLHNTDFIRENDIRIGDTVVLEKGGDVIPKIVGVVSELRSTTSTEYMFPAHCNCPLQQAFVRYKDEAGYYCEHTECPSQIRGRLIHFASRKAMNIEGLGDKNIDQLVEVGLLRTIADIYSLHEHVEKMKQLERWGEKKIENLLLGITASKKQPFEKILFAMGIRFVGEETARILVTAFGSIENLLTATVEQLTAIHGVGERTAFAIVSFFAKESHRRLIAELHQAGLQMSVSSDFVIEHHPAFVGKTFVITGTLSRYSREEASKIIQQRGGKVSGSVSKKTHFVVSGHEAGSKLTKALELGIPILQESDFEQMFL